MLPVESPVAVAEQVATLDQVSGGRVVLGVAMGYRRHEYDVLGVPFRRRGALLEQGIEALHWAWSQDASQTPPEGAHLAVDADAGDPHPGSVAPPADLGRGVRQTGDRPRRAAGRRLDWRRDADAGRASAASGTLSRCEHGRRPPADRVHHAQRGHRHPAPARGDLAAARGPARTGPLARRQPRGKDDGDLGARLERGERLAVSDLARNRASSATQQRALPSWPATGTPSIPTRCCYGLTPHATRSSSAGRSRPSVTRCSPRSPDTKASAAALSSPPSRGGPHGSVGGEGWPRHRSRRRDRSCQRSGVRRGGCDRHRVRHLAAAGDGDARADRGGRRTGDLRAG